MKRNTPTRNSSVRRILEQFKVATDTKDFQQGIDLLERANRLEPGNVYLRVALGGAHGLRMDYAAAEKCFEQALKFSPRPTDTLAAIGRQCQHFYTSELAQRYWQRAIGQKDATADMIGELAELCERHRRIADARSLIDRALHLNPDCPAALIVKARLERQAGALESAEKILQSFPANAAPDTRVRAWYELGDVLDRLGRYDEAMAVFHKAKWLLRPYAGELQAALRVMRSRMSSTVSLATAEVLRRWVDECLPETRPHRLALLGGHPRSGTTLLEQVLDSHPDIISAEETDIFLDEALTPLLRSGQDSGNLDGTFSTLAAATPMQLNKLGANYFRAMEIVLNQSIAGRLLIDKNPSLTFLAPSLIRFFPGIKFLIALRDPRDVLLSCFMRYLPLNQVATAFYSLEGGVSEYATVMGLWQTVASRMPNPCLAVRYEDMVEDLESVARKTLDFLGVTWDARVLGFDEHARNKVVRSPTYADVTQPVYKRARGRWRNYQKHLEPYLAKLEPFVKAFGYE